MNLEVCKSIKHGLKQETGLFETLLIDNCGLSDVQTAFILEGAKYQNLKSLTLKNTEID